MKFSKLLTASALTFALALPMAASAASDCDCPELGQPIIELMPHFKKLRTDLQLNASQDKVIDAWMAEAPKKRNELMQEAVKVRHELREALLNRDDRLRREDLKAQLNGKLNRVTEMRSLCARMLHKTLTTEQYQQVVDAYKASLK